MKKITPCLFIVLMIVNLCLTITPAHGQSWKSNTPALHNAAPAVLQAPVKGGKIHIGHCTYNEQIWEWDGLSYPEDIRAGIAVKLTRDMFVDYIGGTVKAMRIGWDTKAYNGEVQLFIRTSFNGPDLATGSGTVRFGWNDVTLDNAFTLPDVEELVVGYYTDLKDGECCISKFYPQNQPNSCFLFSGDHDGEDEVWEDLKELGTLAIMMTVVDEDGRYNDLGRVTEMRFESVALKGKANTGQFVIRNTGSNNISSVEISSAVGDNVVSQTVNLSKALAPNTSSKVNLPITSPASGKGYVSLTKINGVACPNPVQQEATFIAIPEDVAKKYTKRPLLEFFTSENNHRVPTYFDEYFLPDYLKVADEITLVCQHTDDQFMIGDEDDVIRMMLDLCAGDSMKVYMPAIAFDRTDYMTNFPMVNGTPFIFGIPYSGNYAPLYNYVKQVPTFASIDIESENFGNDSIKIEVSGIIEPGVMPADESLYLTVYLMENQVKSDSQKYGDDKDDKKEPGTISYTHYNLVRENLTPVWGQEVHPAEDGTYSMTFYAKRYSDYQPDKLSITAFLNRGEQMSHLERNVINSEVALAPLPVGIESVDCEAAIERHGDKFFINGVQADIYSVQGVRVNGKPAIPGVYILRAGDRAVKMKF